MLFGAAIQESDLNYVYNLQYYGSKTKPPSSWVVIPGEADVSKLPSGLVGYWPLDGDGVVQEGTGAHSVPEASGSGLVGDPCPDSLCAAHATGRAEWTAGKYGFSLNLAGAGGIVIPDVNGQLDAIGVAVSMVAWVRPTSYDNCGDHGVIMNKENHFEMGIESNVGALQAAGAACWRWWGNARLTRFEWSNIAVTFDGTDEKHFIDGMQVEATACGADRVAGDTDLALRIGARSGNRNAHVSAVQGATWAHFTGDIDEVRRLFARISIFKTHRELFENAS